MPVNRIAAAVVLNALAWLLLGSGGSAAAARQGLTSLKVVPEESRFDFAAPYSFLSYHLGISGIVEGQFSVRSGDAEVDLTDPRKGASVDLIIDPSSLTTGNRWRDGVLKKEFLEIERYPEIRFTLTRVREFRRSANPRNVANFVAVGSLSLHGITREIVVTGKETKNGRQVFIDGETTLSMSSYGVKLPELPPFLRGHDEIKVRFHVVLEASPE